MGIESKVHRETLAKLSAFIAACHNRAAQSQTNLGAANI
jgi:hypothetical protein